MRDWWRFILFSENPHVLDIVNSEFHPFGFLLIFDDMGVGLGGKCGIKRLTFIKSLFFPRQGLTQLFFERPKSPELLRLQCKFWLCCITVDFWLHWNGAHKSMHCTAGKVNCMYDKKVLIFQIYPWKRYIAWVPENAETEVWILFLQNRDYYWLVYINFRVTRNLNASFVYCMTPQVDLYDDKLASGEKCSLTFGETHCYF